MKNTKKTIAAAIMMSALTFGTSVANAGIIIAKAEGTAPCAATSEGSKTLFSRLGGMVLEGIIIAKVGIIIAREGIIIAKDGESTCETPRTTEGIIIA
jgi:hypothetical protein